MGEVVGVWMDDVGAGVGDRVGDAMGGNVGPVASATVMAVTAPKTSP